MTTADWRRINELFHAALALESSARARFLAEAAGGDASLLHEVETLLASHDRTAGFLDEPAWGVAADLILDPGAGSLAGRRVGPYRVGEEIGRGGMGVVYAAVDERLGRRVALKALAPECTRDPVRRERLAREARAAAALAHPAIATVFALEEIDGELYIAAELVEGRTLREELAQGPLPPALLLPALVDVAEALAAAHACGIVHRDLKPENVMRRPDGRITVLDFGLASTTGAAGAPPVTRLTEAGLAIGTPGYMAPEQFSGGEVGPAADVFAFGVLAWELATAEHPFGTDPGAAVARLAGMMEPGTRAPLRELPIRGLDAVIRRCLSAAPDDRYPTATPLASDLRRLADGGPAAARPALWWWQCHQLVISGLNAAMALAAWGIRPWMPRPSGSVLFLLILMLATISVTLRLNLFFMSRVHRETLARHRARVFPFLAAADGLLAAALVAGAALIAGDHDEVAALLAGVGMATFASLALVEPGTTSLAGLQKPPGERGNPGG